MPHNHSRNLDMIIISLVLVPTEKHTKPLNLFLTFNTAKIQSIGFFWSSSPNEVLFLTNYHSQNPNPTHIFIFQRSSPLVFYHHQKISLHFLSLHQIYFSSPHPPKSSCQSPCKTMIHKALKEFSLSCWDYTPSHKLIHETPFIIICKATKYTKNRNTSKTIFLALLDHHIASSLATKLT